MSGINNISVVSLVGKADSWAKKMEEKYKYFFRETSNTEVSIQPYKRNPVALGNPLKVNLIQLMEDNGLDPANYGKGQGLKGVTWLMLAAHILGIRQDAAKPALKNSALLKAIKNLKPDKERKGEYKNLEEIKLGLNEQEKQQLDRLIDIAYEIQDANTYDTYKENDVIPAIPYELLQRPEAGYANNSYWQYTICTWLGTIPNLDISAPAEYLKVGYAENNIFSTINISITPKQGAPGTTVTLNGKKFGSRGGSINFYDSAGNKLAVSPSRLKWISSEKITFRIPKISPQEVHISVVTAEGKESNKEKFTVLEAAAPRPGPTPKPKPKPKPSGLPSGGISP